MKKQKIAVMLVAAMLLQTGGSIRAEMVPEHFKEEETSYVIMGEDKEIVEQVIGTEIEDDFFDEGEEEIVVAELTQEEVRKLEQEHVMFEEEILFEASSISSETELEFEETEILEIQTELEEVESEEELEAEDTEENTEFDIELEDTEEVERIKEVEDTEITETESVAEKEKAKAEDAWNLAAVHAKDYVKDRASTEKVKIAVLDSGSAYRASVPIEEHVTLLETEESNPFFEDATGHGTAVTSLIVSSLDEESIQGINEDATVYSVQVLDENNTGTLSGVVKGIYWAIEHDMDIINMSFGTPYESEILEKAITDATEAGILMVAAAGNNPTGDVMYPAAYDEVLAVGASNLKGEIATESTRGEGVDIYAPGAGIMVNAPFFGTAIESGSSLACAQVSGAASVVWEKDRTKDATYIRELLKETANKKIDSEYGIGLLNVEEAIRQLDTFVPGEKTEEKEEKHLLEFDEMELTALWADGVHKGMITGNDKEYSLICAAAAYPDLYKENSNRLKKNRMFHGSKNYMATLEFLIKLAHEYYVKGNTKDIYNDAQKDSSLRYTINDSKEIIDTVADIKWFLNLKIATGEIDETTRRNKACKVMGVAAHVVGDIYAHRALVTTDMLKNAKTSGDRNKGYFIKNEFQDWNKFKEEVKYGKKKNMNNPVEFRNVADYTRIISPDKKKGEASWYEDNVRFETWRYEDSIEIVKSLVKKGGKYDFRIKSWDMEILVHRDKLSRKDIKE